VSLLVICLIRPLISILSSVLCLHHHIPWVLNSPAWHMSLLIICGHSSWSKHTSTCWLFVCRWILDWIIRLFLFYYFLFCLFVWVILQVKNITLVLFQSFSGWFLNSAIISRCIAFLLWNCSLDICYIHISSLGSWRSSRLYFISFNLAYHHNMSSTLTFESVLWLKWIRLS